MKTRLAGLLLALGCAVAGAQSLPYGVSINDLAAFRQADGLSVITGTVRNYGKRPVHGLSVTFVLYDAAGREVGRTSDQREAPLAPGETWLVRATTPHAFTRFTALDIKSQ